jgi:hypothetical protein
MKQGLMELPTYYSWPSGPVEAELIIAGPGDGATFFTAGTRVLMLDSAPTRFPYHPPPKAEKESP